MLQCEKDRFEIESVETETGFAETGYKAFVVISNRNLLLEFVTLQSLQKFWKYLKAYYENVQTSSIYKVFKALLCLRNKM